MAEVYVTLGEAAELERVKYNTMVKRVLRKQESFVTKTEKSENGGKDVVLVAVSSLSKQARNAWKEREKLKSFTEEFPDKKEDEQKPEVPWYVNTDVDWYIENYKERYYKAVELGNVVRKFLQYDEGDRTKYAEEFAQKYLGKGQRTLYRYTKAYLEASAWADKLEKEDGAGREFFKVLCLCRKPKETGCFPSIKPEVKQVIKNIWFNEDFARNQGTREMLYEKLTAIANINKWEKIPSYQTVTRYISYLMEDEGMRNAWLLASRGTREYKNKVMVKGSRDTKGLQVMQIVMGDEQKKLLLKKLKGEFEKDKETLISVLVPEGETVPDFDVELWYIYRIKNGELIKAFLPEEMIDATIEGIRKSILVETKTSITLDYDDTEKEE